MSFLQTLVAMLTDFPWEECTISNAEELMTMFLRWRIEIVHLLKGRPHWPTVQRATTPKTACERAQSFSVRQWMTHFRMLNQSPVFEYVCEGTEACTFDYLLSVAVDRLLDCKQKV